MSLRKLKKEVHDLSDITEVLKQFQNHWLKPIKKNTNCSHPFLQDLSPETKKQINQEMVSMQKNLTKIQSGQAINEKLRQYSRYLIELKLTKLQSNPRKSYYITKIFLHDEYLNLKQTINEVASFDQNITKVVNSYHFINELLTKNLPLEDSLHFFDLPHQLHLSQLQKTVTKQKKLLQVLGKNFIDLVRDTRGDLK